MIKKLRIQNYKSVVDLTLELGKTNVFIGENGCGKTNILEAVAMLSGAQNNRLLLQDLASVGVRVAKPSLTYSSFNQNGSSGKIKFETSFWNENEELNNVPTEIMSSDREQLHSIWKVPLIKISRTKTTHYSDMVDSSLSIQLSKYLIYDLNSQALRGITSQSLMPPMGIYGEGLDIALASFKKRELKKLLKYKYLISWLDEIVIDTNDELRLKNSRAKGNSLLYFSDKYMKKNALFNLENANEGVLHILFYLTLFIHKDTSKFFAIDNIETALNPHLCRELMKVICDLNKEKQVLITTHNPAILDGLDLTNDDIRLFAVRRNRKGHTDARRIQFKEGTEKNHKLSEMWMRGMLGAIPTNF